jgi:hypothetical protein
VAARVVGDREDAHAWVGRELPGDFLDAAAAVGGDQPAARDELGRDDERARLLELRTERRRREVGVHFLYQSA